MTFLKKKCFHNLDAIVCLYVTWNAAILPHNQQIDLIHLYLPLKSLNDVDLNVCSGATLLGIYTTSVFMKQ